LAWFISGRFPVGRFLVVFVCASLLASTLPQEPDVNIFNDRLGLYDFRSHLFCFATKTNSFERFELAEPGKDSAIYSEAHLKRMRQLSNRIFTLHRADNRSA
jgi:hypothetical protein